VSGLLLAVDDRHPKGLELRHEVDLRSTLEDLEGIAKVIRRSTDRAVRIVGDLLHFSRASSDRVPTDLHVGLDEALSLLGTHLRHAESAEIGGTRIVPRRRDSTTVHDLRRLFRDRCSTRPPRSHPG